VCTWDECVLRDTGLSTLPLLHTFDQDEGSRLVLWGLRGSLTSCGNVIKFLKTNLNLVKIESKIDEVLVEELN